MSNGSGLFSNAGPLKPHLMQQSGGIAAEVNDLRRDVGAAMAPMAAQSVDEYINAVAGTVAMLLAATATSVAVQTITTFLAPGVAALLAFGRNVTLTTSGATPADAPATALVTGTYNGAAQTETINVPQTATTAVGVKPFDTVTSVLYSAGQGAAALVSIGVGDALGTSETPVSRAGLVAPTREIAVGAVVTTGTLTVAGLYTPAAPPDGTKDYCIYYEYDPTV